MTLAENAARYVARMDRSVSGSGGRVALFNACAALMRGFSLAEDVAFSVISSWNQTHSDPPWNERELRKAVREGAKADRAEGYLLKDRQANPQRPSSNQADDARKREQRAKWPAFHPLSDDSMRQIAALRKLPLAAVHAVVAGGFLKGAMIDGHRSFIITEGIFAQARRFDGEPFTRRDGERIKAKNLPGSQGAFVGRSWLGDSACPVLLVEGAVGLLEGAAAVLHAEADVQGWAVLAATSAGSRFTSEWLEKLRGRRVRIVPDVDTEGMRACGIWAASLESVGCDVDAFQLPAGLKDLGPLAADPPAHQGALKTLFTL